MDPTQEGFLPMTRHPWQREAALPEIPKPKGVTRRSESIACARGCQTVQTSSRFFERVLIGFCGGHVEQKLCRSTISDTCKKLVGRKRWWWHRSARGKVFHISGNKRFIYLTTFLLLSFFLFSFIYVGTIEMITASYILVTSQGRPDSNSDN